MKVARLRAVPPIRSLGDPRSSLLVCDGCDALMTRDGKTAAKPHRESNPDERAPHYMPQADLQDAATTSGWVDEGEGRWSCPPCSSRRG